MMLVMLAGSRWTGLGREEGRVGTGLGRENPSIGDAFGNNDSATKCTVGQVGSWDGAITFRVGRGGGLG